MLNPAKKNLQSYLFDARLYIFVILFLVSGCAGLIYEIVWERLLEVYFGVTMVAIALIVAAYMGGLGLGSLVGGRTARHLKSVLFVYGLVEMGVALFGLVSVRLITWIGKSTAGSSYVSVFLLSFILLLVPTFLMGMTLPLLAQAFIVRVDISGHVIGLLYGINTLGAALGAGLAGYVLIGQIGFIGAVKVAVIMNAVVGLVAVLLNLWRPRVVFLAPSQSIVPSVEVRWDYHSILFASFLVGFIGLGYEMLWVRILSIINKNTAYNFPTILTVFLVGLALGGYYWGRKADRTTDPVGLFWKVEIGTGIVAALVFLAFWYWMKTPTGTNWLAQNFNHYQRPATPMVAVFGGFVFSRRALFISILNYLPPVILIVLPASLLMGGGLPILDRMAINSSEVAGRRVGDIHLINILGSVFGTLTISFILLPMIGSELTLKILILLSLTFLALYLKARKVPGISHHFNPAAWIMTVIAFLAFVFLPNKSQLFIRLFETATHNLAVVHETSENVLVLTMPLGNKLPSTLWIGGEKNSIFPSQGAYEVQAMACAGASQPKRILIIGLGGGNTAFFYSTLPGVEQIIVVELIPDLAPFLINNIDMSRTMLMDPHVYYIADDGRRFLNSHPDDKYDLISMDPVRNYTTGHNNLYSIEAISLYQTHLSPKGVLCQWEDDLHVLPRTVAASFPYEDQYDGFAIASNQPIQYDMLYMESAAQQFALSGQPFIDTSTIRSIQPQRVLERFLRDRIQILEEEQETPVLEDFSPWLEYYLFHKPIDFPNVSKEATLNAFVRRIIGCNDSCIHGITGK